MSWKPSLSLVVALAALAGCSAGPTGQPASTPVAQAEAMKDRLANQARAIVELSAANEKLLARIEELNKEIVRLQAQIKGSSAPATAPALTPTPAPIPAPVAPPAPPMPPGGKN